MVQDRILHAQGGALIYRGLCPTVGQAYIPSGSCFLYMCLKKFVFSLRLRAESYSKLRGWCEVT